MSTERTNTVIIGGGQAGLAISYPVSIAVKSKRTSLASLRLQELAPLSNNSPPPSIVLAITSPNG